MERLEKYQGNTDYSNITEACHYDLVLQTFVFILRCHKCSLMVQHIKALTSSFLLHSKHTK